jgi:hypothetical protein
VKTRADELKIEIAQLDEQIARNDLDIEEHERRQDLRRQHGNNLHMRRLTKQAQLEREEARLIRPEPERVDCGGWSI